MTLDSRGLSNMTRLRAVFVASAFFFVGCKRIVDTVVKPQLPPPRTGNAEPLAPELNISLDASLTMKERDFLREDFKYAQSLKFKEMPEGYFTRAFGSDYGTGLLKYLDDRIGHIIGPDTSVETRFNYTSANSSEDNKALTIATNIGTAVWLETIAQRRSISFFTNNTAFAVTDPRIGIIKLGKAYTVFDQASGRALNTVARTSILVHEARHSDCTGGLNDRDMVSLTAGQLPENRSCGHLHTICASGDYEGLPACDGKPWGAYAIGWLFANEIVERCDSCTEAMRQTAMAVAIDSLSRLPPEMAKAMRNKTFPPPDMSSTPPVR
jgi:hypothetical protein